jgi:glucose/arabinose dehydrogenase
MQIKEYVYIALITGLTVSAAPAAVSDVQFQLYADGFTAPLLITNAGDGSNRLFVVEQDGKIFIVKDGVTATEPFLDLGPDGLDLVLSGGERGLLGLAFHPDYATNGFFYVDYTRDPDGATVVSRFEVSAGDPDRAATQSETIILGPVAQPEANHNAGQIAFGPDGYLYIGLGDGGGAGDNHGTDGNGQNTNTLLGSILRIDVDGDSPYAIPPDNPFADNPTSGLPEIYAFGLRNPYRFSFDREDGRLFCADVGQSQVEEIDIIVNGGNYGWRCKEGTFDYNLTGDCPLDEMIPPIHEYTHTSNPCDSVTGGYVYRGAASPAIQGSYFYADYCRGEMWALKETAPDVWTNELVANTSYRISSFGEDESGEMYFTDLSAGEVYKLVGPTPSEVRMWRAY